MKYTRHRETLESSSVTWIVPIGYSATPLHPVPTTLRDVDRNSGIQEWKSYQSIFYSISTFMATLVESTLLWEGLSFRRWISDLNRWENQSCGGRIGSLPMWKIRVATEVEHDFEKYFTGFARKVLYMIAENIAWTMFFGWSQESRQQGHIRTLSFCWRPNI